jgi:hypothetical protein
LYSAWADTAYEGMMQVICRYRLLLWLYSSYIIYVCLPVDVSTQFLRLPPTLTLSNLRVTFLILFTYFLSSKFFKHSS